jgi:hypothetical protein
MRGILADTNIEGIMVHLGRIWLSPAAGTIVTGRPCSRW